MPPNIIPVTTQTYRQAALVLGKAFVNEPVSAFIYRNYSPEKRIKALAVDFAAEMKITLRKGFAVHVEQDGMPVAAALLYPPGEYPLPQRDQWLILLKSVMGNGWYDVRSWMKWLDEAEKVHPTIAHYYLPCIGVDPACQGCGLGSVIMAHLAAKADQEGVGCYLENSDPRNLPFYERFGFRVINEKQVIGLPTWYMWREPK